MRLHVPTLETERLKLEPLTLAHSAGMYRLWARPEVCEYSGAAMDTDGHPISLPAESSSESDKIISFFSSHQRAGAGFRWAALAKTSRAFIGALGFNSLGCRPELAYHLHPDHWGQGLMSEACQVAISWAFADLRADCVEAYVDVRNERSIFLLDRLGFSVRGEARDGAVCYACPRPVA